MASAPKPTISKQKVPFSRSASTIYKYIFETNKPEVIVSSLPSQTLYCVIKDRGLDSSYELLEIIPTEIYRTVLDFDLWKKDTINEEALWEWLLLADPDDPLKLTQKLLKSIDLKIIAWLATKYIQVLTFEITTENPPGPGWYTPDKGYTWIFVNLEDSGKHFALSRLLALIFETNTDLFYQILAIPTVSTSLLLEEEAFLDKSKRLASEGVPEFDFYQEINSSLFPYQAKEILNSKPRLSGKVIDIPIIEPLIHINFSYPLNPIDSTIANTFNQEVYLSEFILILNASLQYYQIPFYDWDQVKAHALKVKGAINIGLEKCLSYSTFSAEECLETLGLTKLYRLGLFLLRDLSKIARSFKLDELKGLSLDPVFFNELEGLQQELPIIKKNVNFDYEEFSSLSQVVKYKEMLQDLIKNIN